MSTPLIRVGLVGLNAKSSWATNAHLPYLKSSSKYKIVALLNSSVEKAQESIQAHGLPKDTKAYGSPTDLAADGNIDLVVCSTRVDTHYPILKPILESGKMRAVFSEWPLGKDLAEAEEMTALAEARGLETIVGLQGRTAPAALKAREYIHSGKIGKVLSVTVTAAGYHLGAEELESLSYLSDINTGGNLVTIHWSHIFDTVTETVGQLASYTSILETKRPVTLLRDKPPEYKPEKPEDEPAKIVGSVPRTSYDQILIQGHLTSGALISFHLRGGLSAPDTKNLVWSIYGEYGELRITTPSMNLHFGGPGHELWHHDHRSGSSERIELDQDEFDRQELAWTARGPARLYKAFAAGRTNEYADWKTAIQRHRLVEELYKRKKEGSPERKSEYLD